MPKQTFFNLPKTKREVIEQAALDEFAEYGFDNSNMNRIVGASGISKGSFYQYFDDKKDLYYHLIDTIVTQKMKMLEPVFNTYEANTFSYNFEETFRIGLELADSKPKYYLLGEDFAAKQPAFIKEFVEKYNPLAMDIYAKFLERANQNGELREGLDIGLVASFISSLINQTTVGLIAQGTQPQQRDYVIAELIAFIERSILKSSEVRGGAT
ncbi:MAG: TetR/AcrR family transcriptional regulator [Propionibacteriaceae bacterium]|nr:TetR/AcrR family transcriptional regulator [Propionibacteriaceae bacterium]